MLAKGCIQLRKNSLHFVFVRGGGFRAEFADPVFDGVNLHNRLGCGIASVRGIPDPM